MKVYHIESKIEILFERMLLVFIKIHAGYLVRFHPFFASKQFPVSSQTGIPVCAAVFSAIA